MGDGFVEWLSQIRGKLEDIQMKIGHRYEVGSQPCQNLKRGEGSFPGVANVHQCPVCWGHRTFCENCCKDHHDNGWDTCKPNAYECAEEDRPPLADVL